jgi:hypothetical protein
MRHVLSRVSAWLPYVLLGPISGPLAVGMMRSARSRRWMMTAVYAVAIVEAWALLAAAEVYFGAQLLNA